ncbi:MAG: hypothetical protein II842_02235 [Butyrivibrio sp.]|nr:hypothetical protein [Butyrivibrio sp.]
MKKRTFSMLVSVGVALILLFTGLFWKFDIKAFASDVSSKDIVVNNEYTIPDSFDWCTYYVVVATNNTGKDICISADFVALDNNGNVVSKVNDYTEAVRKDQQFILYGQFLNTEIKKAVKYQYVFNVSETDNCTYNSVDLDTSKIGGCIEVSATNYSSKDIQGVGVRTVFLKNGRPVAFDTVNIADVGYVFHGGSTNSQVIGYNAGTYDDYIMTYTSAGNGELIDF